MMSWVFKTLLSSKFLYKTDNDFHFKNSLKLFHSDSKQFLQVMIFLVQHIYISWFHGKKIFNLHQILGFRMKLCSSSKYTWPWNFHLSWGRIKPLLLGLDKYPMASSALKFIENSWYNNFVIQRLPNTSYDSYARAAIIVLGQQQRKDTSVKLEQLF